MAEGEDKSAKTEEPTASHLEKERKKGQLAKGQDVPVWFMVLGLTGLVSGATPLMQSIGRPFYAFIDHPHQFLLQDTELALALFSKLSGEILLPLGIMLGVLMLSALAGHLVQHRPVWTFEKLKPKLEKISPVKGVVRLFGAQGWMNLIKAVLKLVAVSSSLAVVLWFERGLAYNIGLLSTEAMVAEISDLIARLLWVALLAIGVVAVIDYAWQRYSFMQQMKMSRRDIKEETKQAEGDPQVRARLRTIRQQRARNRMMASVPEATVVIANPTHYAVALRYDPEEGEAPVCVARGLDVLALRIREIAEEAGVPVMVNPLLARALHAGTKLDEPIPIEHYQAVAKVISFVMQTRKN